MESRTILAFDLKQAQLFNYLAVYSALRPRGFESRSPNNDALPRTTLVSHLYPEDAIESWGNELLQVIRDASGKEVTRFMLFSGNRLFVWTDETAEEKRPFEAHRKVLKSINEQRAKLRKG